MATSNFTTIPTIDLSHASSPSLKPALLSNLRHALTSIGFLYITNHAVPTTPITKLLPPLFSLPSSSKSAAALQNSPHFLGYSATGAETTAGKTDAREQFEFCTPHAFPPDELSDDGKARELRPEEQRAEMLKGPNQFLPNACPDLQATVTEYIESLTNLSTAFLSLVAEALNLAPDTFLVYVSDTHRLKLVHYPPLPPAPSSPSSSPETRTQQGVGPHKDSSGFFTFLLQASPPHVRGLQALNKRGDWIDVPNVPGSLVVNIGQGFEVVTAGVCKATVHRVVVGEGMGAGDGERGRFSVPFFLGMRRDLRREKALGLSGFFGEGRWKAGRGVLADADSDAGVDGEKGNDDDAVGHESLEASAIDSPWLQGAFETWGEAQLRTKIRSHRDVGARFYADVFAEYTRD